MLNLILSQLFNERGIAMSWRVISSVICPNTGIVYSSILGLKFLKLIIWYESDVYLYPGDRIYPTKMASSLMVCSSLYRYITYHLITRCCGVKLKQDGMPIQPKPARRDMHIRGALQRAEMPAWVYHESTDCQYS